MINLFSWLVTIFAGMFWVFRLVVTFCATMGIQMGIVPLDTNVEIGLLFVTLFALVFIVRRNMLGPFIYLVSYGLYFGVDVYNVVTRILEAEGEAVMTDYASFMFSFLAIVLAFLVFFDVLINKDRKGMVTNKKTDFFYGTDKYDREKDERADKNQYKF